MSLQPLAFTGVSSLSDDLQTVLSRAVFIASIPLQQLQNRDADVLQRNTLVTGLSTDVTDLAGAVSALGDIASEQALAQFANRVAR